MLSREARHRLRRSLDAGPEPYKHLDIALATRLGGAIWLVAVFYALIVLPLAPPEGGVPAWTATVAILAGGTAVGVWQLRRRTALDPTLLLWTGYVGVAASVAFRVAAGPGAPFSQFLLLATLYACAIHPYQRAFGVVASATVAAFTPLALGDVPRDFWANTVADIALWWSLGLILVVWGTRTRNLRRELGAAREQAELHARVDALTGLGNRRALEEALTAAVASAHRHGRSLCALVADLDGFKAVNDNFGHAAGDALLQDVARALTAAVRVPDPCFRWGGDEFVALLPDAGLGEAERLARRVADSVSAHVRCPDGTPAEISVGVAALGATDRPQDLLERADEALLAVKDARRSLVF